jgi:SiaC family regulatory phosphoprotein
MQNLVIEETKYSPKIVCDAQDGQITMTGKSYPENTFDFYEPVMRWIERYFGASPNERTVVSLNILYFNSSSLKLFVQLFDMLEANSKNSDIEVNWLYDKDNESAKEVGEDFMADFENLKINLVAK